MTDDVQVILQGSKLQRIGLVASTLREETQDMETTTTGLSVGVLAVGSGDGGKVVPQVFSGASKRIVFVE
jgi:hypothetical protein